MYLEYIFTIMLNIKFLRVIKKKKIYMYIIQWGGNVKYERLAGPTGSATRRIRSKRVVRLRRRDYCELFPSHRNGHPPLLSPQLTPSWAGDASYSYLTHKNSQVEDAVIGRFNSRETCLTMASTYIRILPIKHTIMSENVINSEIRMHTGL